MANSVKNHETNLVAEKNQSDVNAILEGVENVPFALSGATTKSILYALFSGIAAVELTSALGFYGASLGASLVVAFTVCSIIAGLFHYLLHSILSNTAHGIVFKKRAESKAMSTEVVANIVLSVVLLLAASCTVFFVGKKGFAAYRGTEYEAKVNAATPTNAPTPTITPEMLTNKRGKVSVYKLELLGKLEGAKAATTDATTDKNTTEKAAYDKTTNTITDIVGASAFVLEVLLALLAFTIATAKKAAVMEEIARRNSTTVGTITPTVTTVATPTVSVPTVQTVENHTKTVEKPSKTTPTVTPTVPTPTVHGFIGLPPCDNSTPKNRAQIGFATVATVPTPTVKTITGTCPTCQTNFEKTNPHSFWRKNRTEYLID
jgi:hypothetical protein